MKKTITVLAAVLAVFMMASCQVSERDSGDTYTEDKKTEDNTGDDTKKKTETEDPEPEDETEPENEEVSLDFSVTHQYSMNVGDTVTVPDSIGECEVYYEIQSGSDVVEISGSSLSGLSVGNAVVKATDWNNENHYWLCSVSVTAEGFSGSAVEYKLLGIWKRSDGSSLILYKDMTGTMKNYLNGNLIQDWSFSWSGSEGGGYKFLNITGCYDSITNGSVDDKQFTVTSVSASSLSLSGYLAFGMPKNTVWSKE